jgi:hypothetical protein
MFPSRVCTWPIGSFRAAFSICSRWITQRILSHAVRLTCLRRKAPDGGDPGLTPQGSAGVALCQSKGPIKFALLTVIERGRFVALYALIVFPRDPIKLCDLSVNSRRSAIARQVFAKRR